MIEAFICNNGIKSIQKPLRQNEKRSYKCLMGTESFAL